MMKKLLLVMLASLLVFGLMNCDSDTTTGEESHYMIQGVWDVLVKETGSPDDAEPYYTLLIGPDRITKTDNYGQVISYKTIFKGKFDNASKDVAGYYQFNYEMLDFKTEDSVGKYEMGYNENTDDLLVYSWSPTGKYVFQEVRILLVNGDTITIPGYTNPEITYARGTGGGIPPGGGTGPFTVTFNANGGTPTPPPQTVDKDDKATAPTGVTNGTRTLLGWYRNAAGTGTAWDFAVDTVTANITLYAKWEVEEIEVVFGMGDTEVTVTGGASVAYVSGPPTGYTITYGSGANTDYGNVIGRFKVDLGTDILGDFSAVELTYKGNAGDIASKKLHFLASNTEADVTGYKSNDDIKAVMASVVGTPPNDEFYQFGEDVDGTTAMSVSIPIENQKTLTGEVWFAFFMAVKNEEPAGTNTSFTITDVKFVP